MSESWAKGSDTRWRTFRLTILTEQRRRCELLEPGCTGVATQVHHIVSLARGGAKYDPGNCAAACRSCNLALGDRPAAPQPEPRPFSSWST